MKRTIPYIPPTSDERWKNIILGQDEYNLHFLAAKILLTRLKLMLRMNENDPTLLNKAIREFRELYVRRGYLPDARKDLKNIFGVE